MIGTTICFLVKLFETIKIEMVNNSVGYADRIVAAMFSSILYEKNVWLGM